MPRKPTTVRIGRDSKGAYIKYGRQKIYISKSVQQQLASSGRESLTEFLVKWIVKHFSRRRRRRRDREDSKASKEFGPPPTSIGTTGLPEAKVKSLPLEAQRQHLVALSMLARPPAEQQRYLEDKRQDIKQSSDAKNNRRFIEAPAPSDDEVYGKEGERFYIEEPDGKQQPVPKSLVPALKRSGELMQQDINTSRLGKLQTDFREKKKLADAYDTEINKLINEGKEKRDDGSYAKLDRDVLRQNLFDLGVTKLPPNNASAQTLARMLADRIRMIESDRALRRQYKQELKTIPFSSKWMSLDSAWEELNEQLKKIQAEVDDLEKHKRRSIAEPEEEQEDYKTPREAPTSPPVPTEKSPNPLVTVLPPGAKGETKVEEVDDSNDDAMFHVDSPRAHIEGTLEGAGLKKRTEPLTDAQIDDLMSDLPGYLGTICKDEIPGLTDSADLAWNAGRPFGFITLTLTRAQAAGSEFRLRPKDIANADDLGPVIKERRRSLRQPPKDSAKTAGTFPPSSSSDDGQQGLEGRHALRLKRPADVGHWVAVACIPDTQQLAYYDSFGVPAPADIKVALKDMFDKIAPRTLLKFKENLIQEQSVDTDNCGWFCIQFLLDMFHGRKFTEATPYNKVLESERNIEQFKKRFKPFSWL